MAIIPGGQQIRTTSADVDLTPRGNALVKAQNQVYTMDDIVETVGELGSSTFEQAVFYFQKGLSSWSVKELYNDTGLTFTWSNPNSNTIHADVTEGTLYDVVNDIYSWGTINSPVIISGGDVQLPGVHIQSSSVDIREARLQSDGSAIGSETSFSGIMIIRRMIVTNPIVSGS